MPLLVNCYCSMYFSEHQEFSKEIGDTKDPRIREDLERELDALVSRMEAKSHQISKIRKHQERVSSKMNASQISLNSP